MDIDLVRQLVFETLEAWPLSVTHMPFGHNSTTYDVALPDRNVMVRTNTDPAVFAGTERNLDVLREQGLPVPQVVASNLTLSNAPFAYIILDKIPGRDLRYELGEMTFEQMTRLAEQIVGFQRRVTMLPSGAGYGYVAIGAAGPHPSWWDLIRPRDPVRPNAGADREREVDKWEEQILSQVSRHETYFRRVPPTCFLDDVTTKNVIVQNGELRGLIDFDCVCYGDPLYWLGLTSTAVVCDVGARELFYVEELKRLWGLTAEERSVLALYSAWISLDFVRRFTAEETQEWFARMIGAISHWLDQVR